MESSVFYFHHLKARVNIDSIMALAIQQIFNLHFPLSNFQLRLEAAP